MAAVAFRIRSVVVGLAVTTAACLAVGGSIQDAQAGPPPTTASAADKKAAQQKFETGVKLFKLHRYKDALGVFRSSYDVVASPATHLMIGKTLKELGQLVEAFDELDGA